MTAHPCLMLLKLIGLPDPVASSISPFPAATGVTKKKHQQIFHNIPSKATVMGFLMQRMPSSIKNLESILLLQDVMLV